MPLSFVLKKVHAKQNLSVGEAQSAFDAIFTGDVSEQYLHEFLLALHDKGETTDEILGATMSMRAKAVTISVPDNAIDIVGTGGDAHGTLNISTATAFIVAACGVPVAKHGNRAATSKAGSSDVLRALGINLEADFAQLEECVVRANLCFLFAPRHHLAMRHVAAVRSKLGMRTIFNLLGPLTNPANVKRHVIGVYANKWLRPVVDVLHLLGSRSAWVTHGQDGMDELSSMAPSNVVALQEGAIRDFVVSPQSLGLQPRSLSEIQGGDAAFNAAALTCLLLGEKNAYRDIVALNAAAALVVADKASDLPHGFAEAQRNIDNGAAYAVLRKLVELTNRVAQ